MAGWRATRDLDIGIAVERWEQFAEVKSSLVASGQFRIARHTEQRLFYADGRENGFPVDIIPFGGITGTDNLLRWPPHEDVVTSVAGFREAMQASVCLRLEADFEVRVASIPGLTALKLFAWLDRCKQTDKDAVDLAKILRRYADAGNLDRIYREHLDILEAAAYDLELAGAWLLGRDVAVLCGDVISSKASELLDSDEHLDRLAIPMGNREDPADEAFEKARNLLRSFRAGYSSINVAEEDGG